MVSPAYLHTFCYFTQLVTFRHIYLSVKYEQHWLGAKIVWGRKKTGKGGGGEVDGQRHRQTIQARLPLEIQLKILEFAKNSGFTSCLAVEHKDKGCSCVSRSEPGPKAQRHGWNSHLLSHFLFKM